MSGDGTGGESTFGVAYEHPILSLLNENLNLQARAGFLQSIGGFASTDGAFTLSHSATWLTVGANLAHNFPSVSIAIGGWLDVPLAHSLSESVVSNGVTTTNGSILYSSTPYGLRFGLGLNDRIFPSLPLYPSIFSDFDLEAYRQPSLTFAQASDVGLALRWAFEPSIGDTAIAAIDQHPAAPQVEQHAATPLPLITAQVDFTYLDQPVKPGEGIPITPTDTIFKQYLMLPWSIPTGFHRLQPEAASHFAVDSLARVKEDEIIAEQPNVIAARLRADQNLSIQLRGMDSAVLRTVADYMVTTYRLSPAQIRIVAVPHSDGKIHLVPSSVSLLGPVVTQWIERSYPLQDIDIKHAIRSALGVKNWTLDIEQDGVILDRFSSGAHDTGVIELGAVRANSNAPVIAILRATDTTGHIADASDTLFFHAVANSTFAPTPTVSRFVLIADSTQSQAIDLLLHKIKELLPASSISMDYYFARSGFPAWLGQKIATTGIRGVEASHLLDATDPIGPRAVITIRK